MPIQEPLDQPAFDVAEKSRLAKRAFHTPMALVEQLVFGADGSLHDDGSSPDVPTLPTDRELFRDELLRQQELRLLVDTIHDQRALDDIVLECWDTLSVVDLMLWNAWGRVVRGAHYYRYGPGTIDGPTREQCEALENARLHQDLQTRWRLSDNSSHSGQLEGDPYTTKAANEGLSTVDQSVDLLPSTHADHVSTGLSNVASTSVAFQALCSSTGEVAPTHHAMRSDVRPGNSSLEPYDGYATDATTLDEPFDFANTWFDPFDPFGASMAAMSGPALPPTQYDLPADSPPRSQSTGTTTSWQHSAAFDSANGDSIFVGREHTDNTVAGASREELDTFPTTASMSRKRPRSSSDGEWHNSDRRSRLRVTEDI